MKTSTLVAAALLALAVGPAAAQYRWTDAAGQVHYGDSPPRDAKDVRAISVRAAPPAKEGDTQGQLPFELRRAVDRAPVVLYTGPDCQPCAPAAALLRSRGVPHTERTVSSPDDVQELRRISGGLRLPYLTVGGQSQSGFNPDIWSSLLDTAGYPKGSMLPRSYQWPAAQPLVAPAAAPATTAKAATPGAEVPAAKK